MNAWAGCRSMSAGLRHRPVWQRQLLALLAALLLALNAHLASAAPSAIPVDRGAAGEVLHGLRATMQRRAIQTRGSIEEVELPAFLASHEVKSGRIDANTVALTFDCGHGEAATRQILDTLREKGVRATFFLEGRFIQAYPELVTTMVQDGHEIGSHSMSHPDFTGLDADAIVLELTQVATLLRELGEREGLPPASTQLRFFRFPYGKRSPESLRTVAGEGYQSVSWSVDPRGWLDAATGEMVTEHILSHANSGDIVLQHCSSQADANALPAVIDGLRARGLGFSAVSEIVRWEDVPPDQRTDG